MTTEKFTPGPWRVDEKTGQVLNVHGFICDTNPAGQPTQLDLANARLIAASPVQFDACLKALHYIEDSKGPEILIAQLRAAIKLATGKEI